MSVKTPQYASFIAQDTSRGPSNGIWFDCPLEDFVQSPSGGMGTAGTVTWDDFILAGNPTLNAQSSLGQWSCWADTGSTFTDAGAEGGIVKFLNTSNPKRIVLCGMGGSYRMISGATNFPYGQKLWFECRVALGSIAVSQADMFVGLCDNTGGQITASGTGFWNGASVIQTAPNLFGFYNIASTATDWQVSYQAAAGTLKTPTNLTTLVTTVTGTAPAAFAAVTNAAPTGFVKLGFVFDPTPANPAQNITSASTGQTVGNIAKPVIKFFVNGQLHATFLTSTNVQASTFPSGWMSPIVAFQTGANSAVDYIDWIKVAQLASF